MPVVIIKDVKTRREETGKAFRFGVCYDTSRHAKKTLHQTLSMMQSHDKLMTITVKDQRIDENTLAQEVQEIAGQYGHQATVEVLERREGQSVYQRVEEYLVEESTEENYVDFIAIGNRGINLKDEDKAHLGSMAEVMLENRYVNVIFVPCE